MVTAFIARTAKEIAADRCHPLSGREQGLVGYWPLESDLVEATGHGSDGTLVGGAKLVAIGWPK